MHCKNIFELPMHRSCKQEFLERGPDCKDGLNDENSNDLALGCFKSRG